MNLPDIQPNNIRKFLNKEEIIFETVEQIKKDFRMFGVEIHFSGNIDGAYNELLEQLVDQVGTLLINKTELLMSVLYQVDISQKDIARAHTEFPNYTDVEVIAHQIIFRDLKKVLFKRYFKSKSAE